MYPRARAQESVFAADVSVSIDLIWENIDRIPYIAPRIRYNGDGMPSFPVEDKPPSTPVALLAVASVLDRKTRDVYPVGIRAALAECALRHAGSDGTSAMKVNRAVAWLRTNGHIS